MARIVVIDDEESVLSMIRRLLEAGNHEVIEASDSEEGLEICLQDLPDLVVTDIMMPERGGFEVIKELRQFYGKRVKIIAIAGYGEPILSLALQQGADLAMQKPLDMQELLEAVKELTREQS